MDTLEEFSGKFNIEISYTFTSLLAQVGLSYMAHLARVGSRGNDEV
jgi:hypothetical protein